MNDRDRLDQLGGLLARLEQLPASEARDWMLTAVRGRAVDVETGMSPAPLRALPRDEAAHAAAEPVRAPRAAPPAPAKRVAPLPVKPVARLPSPLVRRIREDVVDLLGMDGVLDLDDAPVVASRPWARGLRG